MSYRDNIGNFDGRHSAAYLVLCVAAASVIYAIAGITAFSLQLLAIVVVSVVVASIAGRYEAQIPKTVVTLRPKDLMAFWAVIWLGPAGGILIALTAAIANIRPAKVGRLRKAVAVGVDVVSCMVSGLVFGLSVNAFQSLGIGGPGPFQVRNDLLVSAAAMGAVHFALRFGLNRLIGLNEVREGGRPIADSAMAITASYSVHVFSTLILFVIFSHFGIEFGLVMLPMVVAGHLAYKMHHSRLEAKTREISEASRLHLATVEALATAIDARDQVGMGHVRRTQIYAIGIGKALGLSEDELNALRTGALLHDIGKLAVPDHILNKPGRLTPAEMEKTKIHSEVGASILENVGFPYPVVPAVKYHHERWDGTGYPSGLMGSQIPLTARILSVADVYDTLRGARPYRAAVESDQAVEILRAGSGSNYDPFIVNTLIDNLAVFQKEVEAEGLDYGSSNDSGSFVSSALEDGPSPNYVQQIKRANREVFTLYSLAKEFGAAADLEESLSLFTEKIRELAPYDTCVIYLMDKSGTYASAVHVDGVNKPDLIGKKVVPGDGATGYVLETRKPVQNVDPELDFAFSDAMFSRDYTAMASLPLISNDGMVGAVSLYSQTVACYADEHLRLLETVSRIAVDSIVRSQQLAEAENHALTDPMTGLPNSRGLQGHFEKESKRADRNGSTFQVLVLDLDGFKAVNDTFGHKVGDATLREIAALIKDQLREYDFLARYGGDEFVAIIPDTETIDVLELSRRIERSVCEFSLDLREGTKAGVAVGVSIGSASYPAQGETFDQIIVAADKAMYITKAIHRQRARSIISEGADARENTAVPQFAAAGSAEKHRSNEPAPDAIDDDLVLELDERHVVESAAIN